MLRTHRTLGCRPIDRLAADKAAMLDLPLITAHRGWVSSIRLPRDHYVRVGSNDYSVDPIAIGRRVQVSPDLHNVTITWGERIVGRHQRHWGKHQTIHDPAHIEAAARMRLRPTRITSASSDEVEIRSLADYDRLLGLDEVVA